MQREWIERRHMPVVSLTVVAPGEVKHSPAIARVFAAAREVLLEHLRDVELWPIWALAEVDEVTGPELLLAVDADPGDLKRSLVALEDSHPWGRLWDIDVVTETGPVSRGAVGRAPRRCLVCDAPAAECARSRRHCSDVVLAAWREVADTDDDEAPTGASAGDDAAPTA